jgi:sorbitol-specific phosphotransferase system component IIBC
VNAESYQFLVYLQVVLTNVALNQTWIALLIALICAFPAKAFRLSPVIAAVAGFSSGFFIPVGALHWG